MGGIVEKYYTVQQLAWLLEFDAKTIRTKAAAGEFGPDVLNIGGKDIRVPASGVHVFTRNHLLAPRVEEPVVARSPGELVRKARGVA